MGEVELSLAQEDVGEDRGRRRWELGVGLAAAFVLLAASIYFFLASVSLLSSENPRVTAGLLSVIIGFALLSASLSILKTAILAGFTAKTG